MIATITATIQLFWSLAQFTMKKRELTEITEMIESPVEGPLQEINRMTIKST
jgi:hypothetical protein